MYHNSKLGSHSYGLRLYTDLRGFWHVAADGPWDLEYDHTERTHDDDGHLTA